MQLMPSVDRLSRSPADPSAQCLLQQPAQATGHHDPGGRPEFCVCAVLAVFIRELIGYRPGKSWCPDALTSACYRWGSAQRSKAEASIGFHVVSLRIRPSHLWGLGPLHPPLLWSHTRPRKRPSPSRERALTCEN
jgi:hypothetical protein